MRNREIRGHATQYPLRMSCDLIPIRYSPRKTILKCVIYDNLYFMRVFCVHGAAYVWPDSQNLTHTRSFIPVCTSEHVKSACFTYFRRIVLHPVLCAIWISRYSETYRLDGLAPPYRSIKLFRWWKKISRWTERTNVSWLCKINYRFLFLSQ